jgi:hypothetical protein
VLVAKAELCLKIEMAIETPDELDTKGRVRGLALLRRSFRVGRNWRNVKRGNVEQFGHYVKASVLSKERRDVFEYPSLLEVMDDPTH